jgi:hypothetical protein
MTGERYCGNKSKKEVHDLDNEKTNCQIDEIIDAGNDRPFNALADAHAAGFDNCHWCLGSSRR